MQTPAPDDPAARRRVLVRAVLERRAQHHPSVFAGARGGRHRRAPSPRWPGSRWQQAFIVLDIAIALVAAAALTYELVSGRDSTPASGAVEKQQALSAGTSESGRALARWADANLPSETRIVSDASSAALLRTHGFTAATAALHACRAAHFLLLTPALLERSDAALDACVASSFAVARSGSGADTGELRAISSDPAATARDRRQDLAARREGGVALAANPAVSAAPEILGQLRDGRLDLRAEAVLAELSGDVRFRIDAIRATPVETRAGMPARVVVIRLADATRLEPVIARIAVTYRPSVVTRANSATLTWPFRAEPPPILD